MMRLVECLSPGNLRLHSFPFTYLLWASNETFCRDAAKNQRYSLYKNQVYHGVRKVYNGFRKVYHGVRKVYHGVWNVYHGV